MHSNKRKILLLTAIAVLVPLSGTLAATYLGLIEPSGYLPGSIGHKLGYLSHYRAEIRDHAGEVEPETLKWLQDEIVDEEIRNCFRAKLKSTQLDAELAAYCDQHRKQVDHLIHLFETMPAKDVPCDIQVPYVVDGCQGEMCSSRISPIVAHSAELTSDLIDGKPLRTLAAGERLKPELEFKTLVKKLGKAKALEDISSDMLKNGIAPGSTFTTVCYGSEGWELACSGYETFGFEADYQELEKYDAEDWVGVETEKGEKGWILYSALSQI